MALLTKIRLGWKSFARGQTLELNTKIVNYGQNNFLPLAPGPNVTKLFFTQFTKF